MKFKNTITGNREPFFSVVNKYIYNQLTVLDIGTGDGAFARSINRIDTYLLDGNEETVDLLKKSFPNVFLGKLPKLDFENNFFDIVHCSHVIEHLEPEILYDTLREIDRVLKEEGVLIISAPVLWSEFYDDLSHIKPYNSKVLKKYLVWGERFNCTRKLISQNYSVLEEIYRYNRVNLLNDIYHPNSILNGIIRLVSKSVSLIGFCKLEKSGYTLVLKKIK